MNRLTLKIALRYLAGRKSHTAVNIISMVSMAGVCVATAALIVVMSVFNGFHQLIESRFSRLDPPLTIVATQGKQISNADSLCRVLLLMDGVEAARPYIEEQALAIIGSRQMAVRMYGIESSMYSTFDSLTLAGEPFANYYPQAAPAIVSVGVANQLQANVGGVQIMGLYVPRRLGRINPANPMSAFRTDSVVLTAAFALDQPEVDRDAVYVPIATARKLLQYTTEATALQVEAPESASKPIANALGPDYRVKTRMELRSGSFQVVNMEKWLTFLLLGFILAIASFNVVSSLSLLVIEKSENAEIMKALGATNRFIRTIYIYAGVLITAIGGLIGMLLGAGLSLGQQHFGWVKLAGEASKLSVTAYPVDFQWTDLIPVALLVAAIGLAASLIATRERR